MKIGTVFQAKHSVIDTIAAGDREPARSRLRRGVVMVACPARAELHQYLIQDDSLSPEQIERIVEHVEICPACQELLDGLTGDEEPPGTTMPACRATASTSTWGPGHSARSGWPRT